MVEGYYFIYTLSLDGLIFYVGVTKRPLARYYDHYHGETAAWPITRYCLWKHGKVCEMNIVAIAPARCAMMAEKNVIEKFSKKYFLLNLDCKMRWYLMLDRPKKLKTKDILAPYMERLEKQMECFLNK